MALTLSSERLQMCSCQCHWPCSLLYSEFIGWGSTVHLDGCHII